jgi:hypothetical protein
MVLMASYLVRREHAMDRRLTLLFTIAVALAVALPQTAAAGSWSPPGVLGTAAEADAAMDADGTAVAVWNDDGAIRVSVRAPKGGFSAPATVSTGGGTSPRVAVGGGVGLVAWNQGGTLAVARATAAGVARIAVPATTVYSVADVGVFPDGSGIVAWDDAAHQIEAVVLTAAGGFQSPSVLSASDPGSNEQHQAPTVAVARNGRAVVTWRSMQVAADLRLYRAHAAYRPAGGRFGGQELIAMMAGPSDTIFHGVVLGDVRPAIDASGNVDVMLRTITILPAFLDTDTVAALTRHGGSWSSTGALARAQTQPSVLSGDLAFSPAGAAIAAVGTASNESATSSVGTSVRPPGSGAYAAAGAIETSTFPADAVRDARIAPLANGRVVVAFRRGAAVRAAVGAPGGAFATTSLGSSATGIPVLSAAGGSEAVAAWLAGQGGRSTLNVALFADGAATAPPSPARDLVAPSLTALRLSPARFAVSGTRRGAPAARRAPTGTTIRWRLTERAKVTLRFERFRPGHRRSGRCVAGQPSRGQRPCLRMVVVGTMVRQAGAGVTAIRFGGTVRGRALRPGRYRLTATATDAARNRSRARRALFTVVGQ